MDPIINPWTIFWLQALINLDKLNQFAFFIILFLDALWLFNFIVIKDAIDKYNSYLEVGYKELNYTSMSSIGEKTPELFNKIKEQDSLFIQFLKEMNYDPNCNIIQLRELYNDYVDKRH